MRPLRADELLLAEAASARPVAPPAERARGLLEVLRRVVPFDAAFLAFADPGEHRPSLLATLDLDDAAVRFLEGPQVARDIELTGTDRARPPLGSSDLPYPAEELATWADCLIPSGLREGLGVALFADGGRHVGHLAVLSASPAPPSAATRRRLARLAPLLARCLDPLSSLLAGARLVQGVTAGTALRADGGCQVVPGLATDPLLLPGSPLLGFVRRRVGDGRVSSSFLWPLGGAHAPDGHARVTVLSTSDDAGPGLAGLALLSPAPPLHGLTPRELEVLGLLVEGCTNSDIARRLVVTSRTIATHLEHIAAKLGTPTRTHAAVRAERDGLYVPAVPC
ncbi:helix-turn-helix transcriptional regulator [Cellulomonas sp. Y8]|uniref:helix-turn-helix transcriptional regulator n=1 Tax=Cellulomonas sp. Y8 TaxID=2591145 RepID=UPI0011CA16DE|nr:helix-turn-helix transcriptional regulator [Cellulomonas sp. Y8]